MRKIFARQKAVFFQIGLACMVCVLMTLIVRCIGPASNTGSGGCRTVHVRVVVDSVTASRDHWQKIIGDLFDNAGRTMQAWARIAVQVDTMEVKDLNTTPSHDSLFFGDCLVKELSAGSSDIVVYFGKTGMPAPLIASMALYELGYVYLQMPPENNARTVDQNNLHLARALAGPHVRCGPLLL